jgi:hypothetical protein
MARSKTLKHLVTMGVFYLLALGLLLLFAKDRTDCDELWKALPVMLPELRAWMSDRT